MISWRSGYWERKDSSMEEQKRITVANLLEEVKEEMCDKYCKYSDKGISDKDIEKICTECPLNKL
jgi:hypothetical protein